MGSLPAVLALRRLREKKLVLVEFKPSLSVTFLVLEKKKMKRRRRRTTTTMRMMNRRKEIKRERKKEGEEGGEHTQA